MFQGSGAASKGDFLFSSDHLIEMATKLYRTTLSQTKQKLNIEISDEYVSCLHFFHCYVLRSQASSVRETEHCFAITTSLDRARINKDPIFNRYSSLVFLMAPIFSKVNRENVRNIVSSRAVKQKCCLRDNGEMLRLRRLFHVWNESFTYSYETFIN